MGTCWICLGEIGVGVPPGRAVGERPGGVRFLALLGLAEVPGEGALMSLRVESGCRMDVEARNCPAWGLDDGVFGGRSGVLGSKVLCFHSRLTPWMVSYPGVPALLELNWGVPQYLLPGGES